MVEDSKLWREALEANNRLKKYWESNKRKPYEAEVIIKRPKLPRKRKKKNSDKSYWKTVPYTLYALRLEDGCYYVGISKHVSSRFKKHKAGKGSQWTALHPPIEIVETRSTILLLESEAAKLEDQLTFEYARKYGTELVRGGGYCQSKPRWPSYLIK